MPVLTEQTVEGASLIEHRQVLVTIFRSRGIGKIWVTTSAASGTDPVGDAIGGEGIIIPVQVSLFRTAADDVATLFPAHSTISNVALFDLTSVDTKVTTPVTFFPGRLGWQIKGFSALDMDLQNAGINILEVLTNAPQTDAQRLRDGRRFSITVDAKTHLLSEGMESRSFPPQSYRSSVAETFRFPEFQAIKTITPF